jgi:hypothetical protein
MKSFVHQGSLSRIVFGVDSVQSIPEEIERLTAKRALVLCTAHQREQAEAIAETISSRVAGIFDGVEMHVPIEVARQARQAARSLGADCALAIGGGSTIGLGKAIALESGLPIIAVPTHVRRQRGHAHFWPDRRRSEEDRSRSEGSSANGHLRSTTDSHAAIFDDGHERHECNRSRG